jgi:peptide/nickel transport system ATP-binding protein
VSARAVTPADDAVLVARDVTKRYPRRGAGLAGARNAVVAVDCLSLSLPSGRVTALVGESGSGKSTSARLLSRIEAPTSGQILLDGQPARRGDARAYRRAVQMVFQDPFASLNPAHTVGYHLSRPLRLGGLPARAARRASRELLEQVNLTPAETFLPRFPHELSGGQRQRVAIALALAVGPRVLIADEPVSMLDVSIRVGILALLRRLTVERGLALLYITHDIASARHFADTIVVMYGGRVVERGPAADVVDAPAHPYTRLLIAAAPKGGRSAGSWPALPQRPRPAGPAAAGDGCVFAPRCPHAQHRCTQARPAELPVNALVSTACIRSSELLAGPASSADPA